MSPGALRRSINRQGCNDQGRAEHPHGAPDRRPRNQARVSARATAPLHYGSPRISSTSTPTTLATRCHDPSAVSARTPSLSSDASRTAEASFPFGFAASFRKKRIHRCLRSVTEEPASEVLSLGDDFCEGPEPEFAPDELDDDVSSLIEAYRFAKAGGYAHASGFRNLY